MVGVSTRIVPGQYVLNSSVTTPVKIIGYGANTPGLCASGDYGCGTYAIVNPAGLYGRLVGIARGLHRDRGVGRGRDCARTSPDHQGPRQWRHLSSMNSARGTGSLYLSGSYDTGTLGGTPSALQAQVSYTAGGPPISGCSACAWTTLS